MNWNLLKDAVASVINTNNNQEITGQLLQNVLNNIITNVGENATFAGIAIPEALPVFQDGPVFYLATTPGIYANFNGIEVLEGEAAIFEWDNGTWSKKLTGFATQKKLTNLQEETDEKLSQLASEIEGKDTTQTIYAEGYGSSSKKWTLLLNNITATSSFKVIAETDITYTGTSNSTFISLDSVPTGDAVTSNTVIAPVSGTPGQMISAGTVIFDNPGLNFTESRDLYIGVRYSGTLKVVFEGEKTEGIRDKVESNQLKIGNIIQSNEKLSASVQTLESKVSQLQNLFVGDDGMDTYLATSEGNGNTKRYIDIFSGVTVLPPYQVIAETDVQYTGNGDNTFVSINYREEGGNNFDIKSVKGTIYGYVIPKGTVIIENDSPTQLPAVSTISIGVRYSGTIKVLVKTSEGTLGLDTQVAKNSADIASNTSRISALESGSAAVVKLYNNQIQKARQLGYRSSKSEGLYPIKPLAFIHVSDTHTSKPNTRAIEVLNYLCANGFVKFLMHTGDILEDPKKNPPAWSNIVSAAQYPVFVTSGNHDVGNWASSPSQYKTDAQFYDFFIAPQINSWGLKTDGGGTSHPTGKNYYFTDLTEEKIRFIVVYEYEIPSVDSQQDAGRGARWISQEQTDWFINSLLTTPQGYGVIVAKHAPDGLIGHDKNPFNSRFKDGENTQQTYQYKDGTVYTSFFADIVQAFVDRTSINHVVTQSAASYQGSLSVVADFSAIASNTEFISFISGHVHADNISRLETHPKLLELNINCDNTIADNQRSEMLLVEGTTFEDVINVYCIDRNHGEVHVLRIGADYDGAGNKKDVLTIQYR